MTKPVTALQADALRAQIEFLTREGTYRTVLTDSESLDGITLVCASPQHIVYDAEAMSEPSAPPPEDGTGVSMYDCCESDVMETHSEWFAAFVVTAMTAIPALLDERDADVRAVVKAIRAIGEHPLQAEQLAAIGELHQHFARRMAGVR